MSKNLVLGVAKGYDWYTLEPFVNSFKKNCPSAELALFVDDLSDFTRDKLIRGGVRLEPFTAKNTPVNARWKFFLDYLQAHECEYEQIFLSDVRDVIFQADIFDRFKGLSNWLGYATDIGDICGSNTGNSTNYLWLTEFFGQDAADKLAREKIICAGTIIGTNREMKILLSQMSAMLNDKTLWGYDQAFLNLIIRENLLPIENLIEMDICSGEILTDDLVLNNKTLGEFILRGDGGIPAVVHQYDRHDELTNLVDRIYRTKNFQFDSRFSDTRSLSEQSLYLLHIDRIAEATRLFLKIFFGRTNLGSFSNLLIELWKTALKKNFSHTVEVLELAIQNSFPDAEKFSDLQLAKIHKLLVYATKNHRAVDSEFKKSFAARLLKICEENLANGAPADYCFRCINMIETLELPPDENFYLLQAKANRIFGRKDAALEAYKKALDLS